MTKQDSLSQQLMYAVGIYNPLRYSSDSVSLFKIKFENIQPFRSILISLSLTLTLLFVLSPFFALPLLTPRPLNSNVQYSHTVGTDLTVQFPELCSV